MGGIAGWITNARRARDEGALAPMLEAIAHRCTASEGMLGVLERGARQQLALGATLRDEASGISLALDGALSNAAELRASLAKRGYSFTRASDSEVLLRAYQHWDKDVVKQLRGQFAFAVWDARKERLLLARDRFGEKPLFLAERDGALLFASEVKALLRAPGIKAQVDLEAVSDCLVHGYTPGPRTLFAGIRKLPAATYALWQLGRLTEVRYWIAPDRNPRIGKGDSGDAVEGFISHLEEAVKLQRGADSGLFLSGGLDSSMLAALMAKQGGTLKTFSLGFEGDKRSELPQAAATAKHFGARHREIVVGARDFADLLPKLVAQRDAPLARPSDVAFHRLAREAAPEVRGVLSGEGCDEVLGGYRRHVAEQFAWGLRGFRGTLGVVAALAGSAQLKANAASLGLKDWRERYVRGAGALGRAERRKLSVLAQNAFDGSEPPFDSDPNTSRLRRILYFDQTGRLPDDLLERGDRMAMAASLELRAPYLDHRLVEHVSAQPDELRVRGLSTKWILREAARKVLPPELGARPKSGFRVPVAAWLRGELREPLLDHLRSDASLTRKYYDAETLDRVVDEHLASKKNHEQILWTLLNLEIWHRNYLRG
jgi:asparagine synthase (glutamine-hydrolysing)